MPDGKVLLTHRLKVWFSDLAAPPDCSEGIFILNANHSLCYDILTLQNRVNPAKWPFKVFSLLTEFFLLATFELCLLTSHSWRYSLCKSLSSPSCMALNLHLVVMINAYMQK